jgi:hypothetical protein
MKPEAPVTNTRFVFTFCHFKMCVFRRSLAMANVDSARGVAHRWIHEYDQAISDFNQANSPGFDRRSVGIRDSLEFLPQGVAFRL